jgi:hypothetical protein
MIPPSINSTVSFKGGNSKAHNGRSASYENKQSNDEKEAPNSFTLSFKPK